MESDDRLKEEQFSERYATVDDGSYRFLRVLCMALSYALYRPSFYGREKIPKDGPVILASNHRSLPDAGFIITSTRRTIRYLAKKELHEGFFGFLFRGARTIPVDRNSHDGKSLAAAIRVLEMGNVIGIFPEGTRNRTAEPLLPFKFGAVKMAQETGAPIIPLVVCCGKYRPLIDKARVYFADPVWIGKDEDLEAANEKIRSLMEQMYLENK